MTGPMDDSAFDTLARAAAAPSRRTALRLLAGALLGGLGPLAEAGAHDARKKCKRIEDKAKRKKCLKKAKKHAAAHKTDGAPPPPPVGYGFVTKWGSPGTGNGQFDFPHGVAVDGGGNVYVTDTVHRVQKFTGTGGFLTAWGGPGSGSGDGQFRFPEGVAVDGAGNVYVTDGSNNRVQTFAPLA